MKTMKTIYKNKCDLLNKNYHNVLENLITEYSQNAQEDFSSEGVLFEQFIKSMSNFNMLNKVPLINTLKDFNHNSEISHIAVQTLSKFDVKYEGEYLNCNGIKIVEVRDELTGSPEVEIYKGKTLGLKNIKIVESSLSTKESKGQFEFHNFKNSQGVCENSLKVKAFVPSSLDQTVTFVNDKIVSESNENTSNLMINYSTNSGFEFKSLDTGETISHSDVPAIISEHFSEELAELSQCLGEDALMAESSNLI